MSAPDIIDPPSMMDQDDYMNPFIAIHSWLDDVDIRLHDLERPQKPSLKIKIDNDEGDVSFLSKLLQNRKDIESDVDITITNKAGRVAFDVPSSWNIGGWAKLFLAAGAVFWYRHEIRIIGRGVFAGANLAIEKWDEKQAQKAHELQKGQEAGAIGQCERDASVVTNASDTPAAVTCESASTESLCVPTPPFMEPAITHPIHSTSRFHAEPMQQPHRNWGGVAIYRQ